MARVAWAEPALDELATIADFIALDNPEAARALVLEIFAKAKALGRFPGMGSRIPELPRLPYRQLVVYPCRVFYRVGAHTVYILHVFRGEQLIDEQRIRR